MKRGSSKKKFDTVFILFSLVLGMLMGWVAKDLEGSGVIGAIIANLGLWVFVSSLLSAWSPDGLGAMLHSFVYFVGVILSYYTHYYFLGGGFAPGNLLYRLIFAVIGAVVGFIVWHSWSKEWLGAVCTAVPVSLLIAEAYPIYHSMSWSLAFDIVCAVILYIVLAPGKYQKLMALPFIIIFTFALVYFGVLSRFFGGWI